MIIERRLGKYLREVGKYFPILSLTGPRQSGKTTLLQQLYPQYTYISFEDPAQRERFQNDPVSFLTQYDRYVIFDEAQRVPTLFSYLQGLVDEERLPSRFILSGSQNFLLLKGITQSLAGRVGIARLFPLDLAEISNAGLLQKDKWETLYQGFYPVHFQVGMPARFFYPNYVATYIERDISDFVRASNQLQFRKFLQVCASLCGQMLNVSAISNGLDISTNTVRSWLSLLEQSYIIFLLPPFSKNFGKRLVKSPKLYFYDTGLAAFLLDLDDAAVVAKSRFAGALFENMVIADLVKRKQHQGSNTNRLSFYRDDKGLEIDLIEEKQEVFLLREIKSSSTYRASMSQGLDKVATLLSGVSDKKVIYGGLKKIVVQDVHFEPWFEVD